MRVMVGVMVVFCMQIATGQESPHGPLKMPCLACHGTDSWKMGKDAAFKHDAVGFSLVGQHKTVKCISCHEGLKFKKMNSDCISCHADVHKSELGANCMKCHTTQSWLVANMIQKHQQTHFPLVGRHQTVQCQSCHPNASQKQYVGTPITCIGCHRSDYEATRNPDHRTAKFSTDCSQCHQVTLMNWGANFDHSQTRFPLVGAHRSAACIACHQNNVFTSLPIDCISCHRSDYQSAANPNHVAANLPTACQTCHTTSSWQGASFDHNATRFPLTGAHMSASCQSCHTNGNYQLVFGDCYQCHQAQFVQVANPNHVSGNFSHNCSQCHSTTSWSGATFDHNTTGFPLTGAHTAALCQSCHVSGNYQLHYTDCYQCHQTQFQQTTNPNHVTGNFSHDCTQCHATAAWMPATFNHSTTLFPLTGAHTATSCQSCHVSGNYQLHYTDCYPCHTTEFQQTTNPNHVAGNFNHNCSQCHSTTNWQSSTFNHSTTLFPLTGAHIAVQCQSCHVSGNYQLHYTDCYACHSTDFQQATNPNHVAGNFSHDCTQCHGTAAWSPATFNHSTTLFPLTGAHTTATCQSCHVGGNYQLHYTDCYACHTTEFQQTTNPNHVAGNFSHNCTGCHSTTNWTNATFNHSTTLFPLTGAHIAVQCQSCHVGGNYQLHYTDCYQCHATDFQQATNPNHVTGNFSHTCTQCHSTTAWSPATFNHNTTLFPLTGAHATTACQSCHVSGNYQLHYTDCYQCHATDFQQATSQNHVSQQFSHNCMTCHSTSVWTPNTMNHDVLWFRIYSGNHRNKWTQCSQCHTTPGNLGAWSCATGCHQNAHHQGQNCYSCHRNA